MPIAGLPNSVDMYTKMCELKSFNNLIKVKVCE